MKKRLIHSAFLAFCIFAGLSAVTHAEPVSEKPAAQADLIAVKEWRLSQIGDKAVAEGAGPTLVFNDKGQLSGSGGVNHYGSEYESKADGQIAVKNIFATEKAALDEDLMNQESRYFRLLGSVKRALLSNGKLVLECEDKDKGNQQVKLVFVAAK